MRAGSGRGGRDGSGVLYGVPEDEALSSVLSVGEEGARVSEVRYEVVPAGVDRLRVPYAVYRWDSPLSEWFRECVIELEGPVTHHVCPEHDFWVLRPARGGGGGVMEELAARSFELTLAELRFQWGATGEEQERYSKLRVAVYRRWLDAQAEGDPFVAWVTRVNWLFNEAAKMQRQVEASVRVMTSPEALEAVKKLEEKLRG
jgi:hypothetical protein